ncbi:hypothetical protein LCGC14_0537090 [marine sediment metagenome]|uniref:Uncharacterized protein n=1 Tax=marine sediment metagenome TaxID=412755 RepID=A0A0F9RYP2_9ZZZZ
MNTKMQQTSLDAYVDIQSELPSRKERVLNALGSIGPMSNKQLSVELDIPINQVTGRMRELVKAEDVYKYDKVLDLISNYPVIRWAICPLNKQLELKY